MEETCISLQIEFRESLLARIKRLAEESNESITLLINQLLQTALDSRTPRPKVNRVIYHMAQTYDELRAQGRV